MQNKQSFALRLARLISLFASLVITGQLFFITLKGETFCVNEGCRIVEQLTRFSPRIINASGLVYFLFLLLILQLAECQRNKLPNFFRPLLLGGIAAEGVLFSFQYLVAHTFCWYCLVILTFIVLLNLLFGFRHFVLASFLFAIITGASASLNYTQSGYPGTLAFKEGVFAVRTGQEPFPEHHLFFSSSCSHCEKIIDALKKNDHATILFNPVDRVGKLDMADISYSKTYQPESNKHLLSALGIDLVPVLITTTPAGLSVLKGEQSILRYLGLSKTALSLDLLPTTSTEATEKTAPTQPAEVVPRQEPEPQPEDTTSQSQGLPLGTNPAAISTDSPENIQSLPETSGVDGCSALSENCEPENAESAPSPPKKNNE